MTRVSGSFWNKDIIGVLDALHVGHDQRLVVDEEPETGLIVGIVR